MGFRMVKIFLTSGDLLRSRSNPEHFGVEYLENGRRLLKLIGQGQTLKTLKLNISKTVRDREEVSIEVR